MGCVTAQSLRDTFRTAKRRVNNSDNRAADAKRVQENTRTADHAVWRGTTDRASAGHSPERPSVGLCRIDT